MPTEPPGAVASSGVEVATCDAKSASGRETVDIKVPGSSCVWLTHAFGRVALQMQAQWTSTSQAGRVSDVGRHL